MQNIKLFLSSPGDVSEERSIVSDVIDKFNPTFERDFGLNIEVFAWENLASGLNKEGAQGLIDEIILPENCEIVVGVLWKRFGTPIKGYDSGTEYELRNALNKWEMKSEPRVMLYFSNREVNTLDIDTEQLQKVNDLRKEFEGKGLVHRYRSTSEFKNRFSQHLLQYIHNTYSPSLSDNLELESIPQFPGSIERLDLQDKLSKEILSNSMVLLQGLSGSGKTILMSNYLFSDQSNYSLDRVLWYKAGENDSLERLFISLAKKIQLPEGSLFNRSKYLFNYLKANRGCLVIDDFENVDADFSNDLIRAAEESPGPSVLIMLSTKARTFYDKYNIALYSIPGYTHDELKQVLKVHGLYLDDQVIRSLLNISRGIPMVAKLFIQCIEEGGFSPEDLLDDHILFRTDVENWYSRVYGQLNDNERKLLRYLSLCDDLFDLKALKNISESLKIQEFQKAFEGLQRSFLIEIYKKSNWRVHPFIAKKASKKLKPLEKEKFYRAIANEYASRVPNGKKPFQLTNDEILFNIKAGRYFKKAGMTVTVKRIVSDIRRVLKKRGDFGILYELTAPTEDELVRDWWLDYHYAHSCIVIGKFREIQGKLVPLVRNSTLGEEKILISKLYAEFQNILGNSKEALRTLESVIFSEEWKRLKKMNIKNIILLYRVNTLIRLKEYKEAEKYNKDVYHKNKHRNNYSTVVSSIQSSWIDYKVGKHEKSKRMAEKGLDILSMPKVKSNRAHAWAQELLALNHKACGEELLFQINFYDAVKRRSDLGDCSLEYYDFLKEVEQIQDESLSNSDLRDILEKERKRVYDLFDEIRKV